jgi:hypothetical protein
VAGCARLPRRGGAAALHAELSAAADDPAA